MTPPELEWRATRSALARYGDALLPAIVEQMIKRAHDAYWQIDEARRAEIEAERLAIARGQR